MTNIFSLVDIKRSLTVLLSIGCFCAPAFNASPSSTAQAKGILSAAANSSSLKGSAQINRVQTEVGLKELIEAIKEMRHTSLDLIGEIERHDMVVVGEPDVLGPVIMPAIPTPSGNMQLGDPLAPRKKWLDIFTSRLGQLAPFLKHEEQAVIIPADIQSEISPYWTEIRALTKDINQHYQNLMSLTAGPNFDNVAIGREALGIYDDTSKFDKPIKEVYAIVRRGN